MRLMLRFLGLLFAAGTILFVVGVAAAAGLLWHYSKSLPDYSQLQDYEPAVMTRVHAADGSLLAEYARERRLYIPIQAVPKLVTNAFIAAEDKNYYEHGGIDFSGIARAAVLFVQQYGSGRRPQGASTITQQVAKNFLLTNELSFSRKIKEALLAMKIERTFSKERILELYLNEIYLGMGAYGVAAASLLYFDKSVHELSPAEAAYLAALPKAPNNYHPFRQRERAIERRNYVLDRMAEDHYITAPGGGEVEEGAAQGHAAADRRPHLRRRIFRRGSAPLHLRELHREEALRGRPLGAHHARPQDAGAGAQGAGRRLRQFRRAAGLPRARQQARHGERVGRQARRHQGAGRHRAVAARRGAGGRRRLRAHRPAARARPRRRGLQGARDRRASARRHEMGEADQRPDPGQDPDQGRAGAERRRRHLCRAARGQGRPVPPAPGARGLRRDRGHGSADRARAGDGRRLLLRPEPVQPRHPGTASAGLVVQAAGLCRRARQRLYALDRRHGRAARDRYRQRHLGAGKLFEEILRAFDAALRHRAVAQRDDRAPGAGRRHAADRRIRQAVRRLRQPAALSLVRARRGRDHAAPHGRRLRHVRQRRAQDPADPDRPHPGPLRPHHLQARLARMPRLRRRQVGEPERADA